MNDKGVTNMNRLKELRLERKWSMRDAAKFLNKPYTTYVNHEKGYRELKSEELKAYAKAYGVSVDYLIGRTEIKTPPTTNGRGLGEEEYEETKENILRDYVMQSYGLNPENFEKLKEYLALLVLSQKDEGNK